MVNDWLVVTGTMEFWMTFQKQLGMENHPNWRTPSFFRGVGSTTNQFVLMICIDDGKKICIDVFLFMICPDEFQDSHSSSHQ